MSYSTSIPAASDPRSQSQNQLLANYRTIDSVWAVNHNSLTGNKTQGYHSTLTFRVQPDPTTSSTQVGLYTKLDSNTVPQLFFRPKSSGTPIQLTNHTPVDAGNSQSSFLAGPFIIYMGILNGPLLSGVSTVTVTPSSTLIYANISPFGFQGTLQTISAVATNVSGSSFTISFQNGVTVPATGGIYYLAIGKP